MALLVDLAEQRLHSAAEKLARANEQLQFEEGRLQELQVYFQEYQRQAKQQTQQGVVVSQIINFNHFLNNLRLAIDQQSQTVKRWRFACDDVRKAWLGLKAKHSNLCRLHNKARQEAEYLREKVLQRELDDNFRPHKPLRQY
ncbi:MAG: hypothetical protein RL336_1742 [Pseudomonadota bacterium]